MGDAERSLARGDGGHDWGCHRDVLLVLVRAPYVLKQPLRIVNLGGCAAKVWAGDLSACMIATAGQDLS